MLATWLGIYVSILFPVPVVSQMRLLWCEWCRCLWQCYCYQSLKSKCQMSLVR